MQLVYLHSSGMLNKGKAALSIGKFSSKALILLGLFHEMLVHISLSDRVLCWSICHTVAAVKQADGVRAYKKKKQLGNIKRKEVEFFL